MELNYHIYQNKLAYLHACIGDVVSKWANVEAQILMLTAWGLGLNLKDTAKITSHFASFKLAFDFSCSICRLRLTDSKHFNSLADFILELSGDRNFIAHTSIVSHGAGHPDDADWATVEPKVGPGLKQHLLGSHPKRDPMDRAEVSEISKDIQHAINLLDELRLTLVSGEPLRRKFLEPIPLRRPRLRQRREPGGKPQ